MTKLILAAALAGGLMPSPAVAFDECPTPISECRWHEDEVPVGYVECPLLMALSGSYGPVVIEPEGDVFVAGEIFWDCPPSED